DAAKALRAPSAGRAAHGAVERAGPLIVGQRPDGEALDAARRHVRPAGVEQFAAEPDALEMRAHIDFVDFALYLQHGRAVPAEAGIAHDLIAGGQDDDATAARNRVFPPGCAAPLDHALQIAARNDAAIGIAPGFVVHLGDFAAIARAGRADID